MQPGLFVALGIFIVIGLLVHRYTRGPLIELRGRRRLRHDTLTFMVLFSAVVLVVLARQGTAWRTLSALKLPLPPGVTHLIGWPPSFADGQAWAIGYHGTIADARRFYADEAPRHGWRLRGDTGSIIFTLVRADTTVSVGVSAGWSDTTLLLNLRRPEGR